MKRSISRFLTGALVLGSTAVSAFAENPSIKMPKPDYTNFYAGVGVVLAISVVVMLSKRLKHFFR